MMLGRRWVVMDPAGLRPADLDDAAEAVVVRVTPVGRIEEPLRSAAGVCRTDTGTSSQRPLA